MLCNVKGIVLRCSDYADNDKLLTLLTHEMGKVVVCVKGGRSIKSKHMPSCEVFSYSEFQLYEKGGRYWVRESFLCESFFKIRRSLESMYLGQYFCEVTGEFSLHDIADDDLLRLVLNSLFLLSAEKKDRRIIKSAFELKAASIEGFLPDISECMICSSDKGIAYFDAIEGCAICSECKSKMNKAAAGEQQIVKNPILVLDPSIIDAMNYIISAPIEKVFSFSLPDDELDILSKVCETYLLHQLERGFTTLDFYNSLV